jgi:hypothetical protein
VKHHELAIIGLPSKMRAYTSQAGDTVARRPYWIHPALSEVVRSALLDVLAAA